MDITKELYMLMDQLAKSTATESQAEILDRIENLSLEEKDVFTMLEYARRPPPNALKSMAFLEILDRIGFPKNKEGLPYIVSEASDINSANWELARGILIRLRINGIPEIRNALRIYSQDCDEYNLYIQGLCQLLEDTEPDISKHTIPELLLLVDIGTDKNYVDEFALWPLKKIGSPNADIVIPKLVNTILTKKRSTRIKKKCVEALKYFNKEKVKQYSESLQRATKDSNELLDAVEGLLN